MRYGAEMLGRVNRIVAQGRPYRDELGGQPKGFNCEYDQDACYAAFDLLVGRRQRADPNLRADWVDIPRSPETCGSAEPGIDAKGDKLWAFAPLASWAEDLKGMGGMAALVGKMLNKNHLGWARSSLWDDLAALYLLRPELFAVRGGHFEPCMPAATIRSILANYMRQAGGPLGNR
jgi:hypothetical protein